MSAVPPQELLKAWKLESLTNEMTLGQVLQNLVSQQTALETLKASFASLRVDVDRSIAHTRLPPNIKSKVKSSKPDETPDPEQPS